MNTENQRYLRLSSEARIWTIEIEQATGRAFDWRCPFCKADLHETGYERSHVYPSGQGIGFVPGNIVLACFDCNRSMGNIPAWEWCRLNHITYWWMLPILETLQKVFAPETLSIKATCNRPTPKLQKVLDWLKQNPGMVDIPCRELTSIIPGVSHMTIHKAQQIIKSDNEVTP